MQEETLLKDVKSAAALLRISTDKTDFSGKKVDFEETLKNHEEKISLYFKEKNWKLKENDNLYKEVLSGGTDYENRPELIALMENMKKYDAIVVMELQRLSRQGYVSSLIKKEIEKYQVLIITLNPFKVYDVAGNHMDSFMYDIGASMSEYERKVASARVKANKISMSRQGLNSSGSVPFGYIRNPQTKKLEIDETKAPIVEKIYKWFLEGMGNKLICDRLNDMGIKNNKQNLWVPQSIRYMLSCPTYKGTLIANNFENKKGKMIATETVVIDGIHPIIINAETWEKVQNLKEQKRERKGANERDWNNKKHTSILDGLVYCQCCGRKSNIKYYHSQKNFFITKCSRFDASGKTCDNGGIKLDNIQAAIWQKILSYKEKLQDEIKMFKSNDFESRLNDLQEQKIHFEKMLENLMIEYRVIRKMEQKYEIQKEITGIEDKTEEQSIEQDKEENMKKRISVQKNIDDIHNNLKTQPSAEKEIKKLKEKLKIIHQIEKNSKEDSKIINRLLKQLILRINYKRILPAEIEALGNKNPIRKYYPAELEIEYY